MGAIMTNATEGHCLCGRVAFSFSGQPSWACFCHCNDCRRNCAAPVVAFIGVALEGFEWRVDGVADTPPRHYLSSPGVRRFFCDQCGTPMAFQADHYAGEIHLYPTTLRDPADFTPEFHVYYDRKLPWLHLADGLHRYPANAPADANARVSAQKN